MTVCEPIDRWASRPRRSLFGKPVDRRAPPNISFKSKREADIWAAIYADESCHPYHRWEVERVGAIYSVAVYELDGGKFSHWVDP